MKIQILLILLVLLVGCNNEVCEFFNGEKWEWKGGCRLKDTNQTILKRTIETHILNGELPEDERTANKITFKEEKLEITFTEFIENSEVNFLNFDSLDNTIWDIENENWTYKKGRK